MILKDHDLSIRRQCQILNVARSSHYYCPLDAFNDYLVMNLLNEISGLYPWYGYRKIHWYLRTKESININKKKVQRLMQDMNIKAIYPGPKTSIPGCNASIYPYLLKDLKIYKSNQVWAVDITYIRLPVGMVYLFALIDWFSRFVVAHKLVNTMEAVHGVEAIE